jgi:hypothetical protein
MEVILSVCPSPEKLRTVELPAEVADNVDTTFPVVVECILTVEPTISKKYL